MRIVLHECLPRRLRHELAGHEVVTVAMMGWSGKRNGELLSLVASAGYDVLLTMDHSLSFQQHLATLPVAVLVMRGQQLARVSLAADATGECSAGDDSARHFAGSRQRSLRCR